jgi:hypothetical protein
MFNSNKIVWFFNVLAILAFFPSCSNVQTKTEGNQAENAADSSDDAVKYYASVVFLLPSPGEILERFYGADLKYNAGLLNSPANKDKYIGSKAQSLNLGAYITDMAYAALFERSTETVNYLEAIQSLSTEAGISSTIFESLVIRSKANAGKIDSLVSISNEAFTGMLEFLESGGKESTIAQISAGAYIESLYIAVQSISKFSNDDNLVKMLAEMKYPMDNLLETAKSASAGSSDPDNSIVAYLKEISAIFNELDSNPSKTVVSEANAGTISISGGNKVSLSEADFNSLKAKVIEIRNKMVSF